jgi:K+-sensing histidine kinase KdpD
MTAKMSTETGLEVSEEESTYLSKQLFYEVTDSPEFFNRSDLTSLRGEESMKSFEEIISKDNLNYMTSTFKRATGDETIFIEFKRKRFVYNGAASLLVTLTDVTNTLKFNEACKKIELLHELQASVSHDMKVPLKTITKSVNILLQKKMVAGSAIQLLKPVLTSSRMLFFQVNELLDQSLIRKSQFTLHNTNFVLATAIKEIVDIEMYNAVHRKN